MSEKSRIRRIDPQDILNIWTLADKGIANAAIAKVMKLGASTVGKYVHAKELVDAGMAVNIETVAEVPLIEACKIARLKAPMFEGKEETREPDTMTANSLFIAKTLDRINQNLELIQQTMTQLLDCWKDG